MLAMDVNALELARSRSSLYKLLSIGYSRPSRELYETLSSGRYEQAVRDALLEIPWDPLQGTGLPLVWGGLVASHASFQDYESVYIGTFDVGMPRPPCPLCEGHYKLGAVRAQVIHEVLTFYKAFGLALSGDFKDLHDHIVPELEFMHFLTYKEAEARKEDADCTSYLRGQRDFLQRHLGTMVPGVRLALERGVKEDFFLNLVRLTETFVSCDAAYLRIQLEDTAG